MNFDDNLAPGTSNLIDAPYNDQTIDCVECIDGFEEDGEVCWFCDGVTTISEREYKDKLNQLKQ